MDALTGTTGILALAAGGLALAALTLALVLAVKLRRLRAAQRAVLGAAGTRDLVAHAAELQAAVAGISDHVDAMARRLDERMTAAEGRLDHALTGRALVRYDAYGELSGHQSASIALLDATGSGVVLSSIHHRDSARFYAKQLEDGEAHPALAPEEEEAVRVARAGERGTRILD